VNDQTDQQLLRDYTERQSEAAFAAIVHRYVDLVYSAAFRMACDAHAAKDVTQGVFVALAQNARQLTDRPALAGWLHSTARNLAAKAVRSEVRRRAREQEAAVMNELLSAHPDAGWEHIAPYLDDALGQLDDTDRDAVLLRYFKNHDLRTVGATLGISDDAAQKRVSRAVERLREFFAKRGVTVGASRLAVVLSANAVQAAPVGLAAAFTAASLASVTTSVGALTILKIMITTKLKLGVVGAIIIAGVIVLVLMQRSERDSTGKINPAEAATSEDAVEPPDQRSRRAVSTGLSHREPDTASVATPKEIVAGKLTTFGRSRRELVDALARHYGMEVPDDVKRFFEAVDRGVWEEIDAAHKVLLLSEDQLNQPRSAELHQIWRPIQEAWGAAREAHTWPAQELLDYGETVLGSLRPGMIYAGGTDPGAFIPALLNETSEGERHITLTQNALADQTYLDYLNFLYSDRLVALTKDDSQSAFQDYLADYQKRLTHDVTFPDEPKQVRSGEKISGIEPGEGVAIDPGKVQASGQDAVMAINERLLKMLMDKNPNTSFAMEVSSPFSSLYGDATPLGPILELRAQDEQNALTQERASQSIDFWRTTAEKLSSNTQATESLFPQYAHAKAAMEQAELFLNHGYTTEAEQAFRLAVEIGPRPESLSRLVNLLKGQGRVDEAISAAEDALRNLPPQDRLQQVFGNKTPFETQFRKTIDELKKLQK
jgi:RNA polymerase sigma factor (sigma-70 family)